MVGGSGSDAECSELVIGLFGSCSDNTDVFKGKLGLCSETEEWQAHELSEPVEECRKPHCSQGVQ